MRHRVITVLLAGGMLTVACGDDEGGIGPSNTAPTVGFTAECGPRACAFINLSTDPDGTVDQAEWNFGDESASVTTWDASHTYAGPGRFTVTLRVTDNDGASATATGLAVVGAGSGNTPPSASFTTGCDGLTCQFVDRSADPDGRIMSWSWDFGDGSPLDTSRYPAHTYGGGGRFVVTLTVYDDRGAPGRATETVTLTEENLPPTAGFTYECADLTCDFTDRSVDPDDRIVAYAWSFGNGETSTEQNPSHTFPAAGYYAVTLTVTDNSGQTGVITQSIYVYTSPDFTVACSGATCTFTPDLHGLLVDVYWDFGDGTFSTERTPTHTYDIAVPATFTVTLTAYDWYWYYIYYVRTHDITVSP